MVHGWRVIIKLLTIQPLVVWWYGGDYYIAIITKNFDYD